MDELPLDEYLAATGCHSEKLTRQISSSPKDLARIARKLNKWREVRPWLDLDEADEDAITQDYKATERQRLGLLEKWKERHGVKATYKELAKAFYDAGRRELVDEVCDIVNTQAEDRGGEQRAKEANQPIMKYFMLCLALGVVFVAVLLVWSRPYNVIVYYVNLSRSPSLPVHPHLFVGREEEVTAVTRMLDFSNDDTRIVSIVGGPGIGKSTLAVYAGHKILETGLGAVILYVDMAEVSSIQDLAEKIFEADFYIVSIERVTLSRLHRWARERSDKTLLILDNCDDVLHRMKEDLQKTLKKLLDASSVLKILMTSRKWVIQVNQFELYQLKELTSESSCTLLQTVVVQVSPIECQEIANLTGQVPLAIRAVGAVLKMPNSPGIPTIIEKLRRHTLMTLSHKELPNDDRVNVSISVSYYYLRPKLRKLSRILVNFPGSFDEPAAHSIFKPAIDVVALQDSLQELVQRSLLQYDSYTRRYHFHRLIKQFFLDIQRYSQNGANETKLFMVRFQWHYIRQLDTASLAVLDTEKHNIHLLVKTLTENAHRFPQKYRWRILKVLHRPLTGFVIIARIPVRELYYMVSKLVDELVPETKQNYELFVTILIKLSEYDEILRGVKKAVKVLASHQKLIETLTVRFNAETRTVISYYTKLTLFYDQLQNYEKVKKYHELMLELTKHLTCTPGDCVFTDIAYTYFNSLRDYEKSAYFFELALKQQSFQLWEKSDIMLDLHHAYSHTGSQSQCERVEQELFGMFPKFAIDIVFLRRYAFSLIQIANFYRNHNETDKANALDDRLLQVMKKYGRHPTAPDTLVLAKMLAHDYYRNQLYVRAAEMAIVSLSPCMATEMSEKPQWRVLHTEIDLYLLAGQALYESGNYSDGLDYLEHALDLIYKHDVKDNFTEEINSVCFYLVRRGRLECLLDKTFRFVTLVYTHWPWIPLTVADELIPEPQVAKPTTEQAKVFSTTLTPHDSTSLVTSITVRASRWFEAFFFHLSHLWSTLLSYTYMRVTLRLGFKFLFLAVDLIVCCIALVICRVALVICCLPLVICCDALVICRVALVICCLPLVICCDALESVVTHLNLLYSTWNLL